MNAVPLRIGYVLNIYPRLSETFVLQEILEMERRGVEVTIFSLRKPDEGRFHPGVAQVKAAVHYLDDVKPQKWYRRVAQHWADLAPHRTGLWSLWERILSSDKPESMELALLGAVVAAKASRLQLDALHAHFANNSCSVAYYAHATSGIPFSFTAHAKDIFTETVDGELLSAKLSAARFAITVSEYNRRFLIEKCPDVNPGQVHVLYNGVNLDFFTPAGTPRVSEDNLILAIGRLVPKKGFADLIRACAILRDNSVFFRCSIVGKGREEQPLRELCTSLDLDAHVTFPGPRPQNEVRDMLQAATVLCQPCVRDVDGNQDALPTVLLESLACGIPAVSTRLAGVPEIIDDGENGLLAEPGDISGLAGALERLLGSAELRAQYGVHGRRKAQRSFDLRKSVETLHSMFSRSWPSRANEAPIPGAGSQSATREAERTA